MKRVIELKTGESLPAKIDFYPDSATLALLHRHSAAHYLVNSKAVMEDDRLTVFMVVIDLQTHKEVYDYEVGLTEIEAELTDADFENRSFNFLIPVSRTKTNLIKNGLIQLVRDIRKQTY